MNFYAVIDTNVVVSAMLKRDSVPAKIIDLLLAGIIIPVFNEEILSEYEEVLLRPEFGFAQDDVNKFMDFMRKNGIFLEKNLSDEKFNDPDDAVFYEIALSAIKSREAYLVTGNIRHFPQKEFVVTPRDILNIVLSYIDK
jgi:putative PIN family toxin of toxin-antitoxin system